MKSTISRKNLRCLVIGLGSMGKRRIRDLKALRVKEIYGYDDKPNLWKEVGVGGVELLGNIIREVDVVFICTPPDQHLKYQIWANMNETPFFTEASVIKDGLSKLIDNLRVVGIPSSTMRFHPQVKALKEFVKEKEVISFSYHSSSNLDDWHPNKGHFYAYEEHQHASKEMIPFALEWLIDVFGEIDTIKGFRKLGISQTIIKLKNGIYGHLYVDTVSLPVRVLRVITPEINHAFDLSPDEQMYLDEMEYTLDVIVGNREQEYTLQDDLEVLKLLDVIESD